MFKAIQQFIFRSERVLALVSVVLFLSTPSQAFQLDSKSLVLKTDYFSKLGKKLQYKGLNELIRICRETREKSCLKKAELLYIDPQFVFFRNLIVELSIDYSVRARLPISKLSFLNKDEIKKRELTKILQNYSVGEVEQFFGSDFFVLSRLLKESLLKRPSLICKYSHKKDLVDSVLAKLHLEEDYLEKNYHKFPCGLDLKKELQVLADEIKHSKGRRAEAYDYTFSFLRDKVSKKAYRNFPKYKKRNLKYKKKKVWKGILSKKGFVQVRIVRNLFYAGKYELLAHAHTFTQEKIEKLSTGVIEFVVKSLVARGEYDRAIRISNHILREPVKAVEEILLMRASSYLRKSDFKNAEMELKLLLKNVVNLKLSGLYWLRVSLKKQNKKREFKKIDAQILKLYPFSYYGILVARDSIGKDFFNQYKKNNLIKQTFINVLSPGEMARLEFYYSYGQKRYFKRTFSSVEKKFNPLQKALFALVFKNFDDQLEVIRSLNHIWDLDAKVRLEPFVSSSFPLPFQAEIEKAIKKLKYTNEALVYAIMRQESAFGVVARSPSGARGLMQLLPSTAKDIAKKTRYKKYRRAGDLYRPEINIDLGARYMDRLIAAGKGYLPYAFASYNAGPGRMYRWSKGRSAVTDLRLGLKKEAFNPIDELWIEELPWSETRFYTKALLRNMGIYMALRGESDAFSCHPFWACHEKKL